MVFSLFCPLYACVSVCLCVCENTGMFVLFRSSLPNHTIILHDSLSKRVLLNLNLVNSLQVNFVVGNQKKLVCLYFNILIFQCPASMVAWVGQSEDVMAPRPDHTPILLLGGSVADAPSLTSFLFPHSVNEEPGHH